MKSLHACAVSAAVFAALGAPARAADPAVEAALEPLAFLAGRCWVATTGPDETDTHCYEWMHGAQQLRDRHVVRGRSPDYFGETVYAWNGERRRVEYRYWNSLGGLSDGYVAAAADDTLQFLEDRYVGPDGSTQVFASDMARPQEGVYRIATRYRDGDAWKTVWTRQFRAQPAAVSAAPPSAAALEASVAQLRHVVGVWDVVTTQFGEDGSVARRVPGQYRFDWVVPDRVLSGRSDNPELGPPSGILFYVSPDRDLIEMVSVSADGHLWRMSGPAGGETRSTPAAALADGRSMKLRFTRSNVEPDRFESRMEVSFDDGATWRPGNHQQFTRARP